MARVTVEDCIDKVENRFELVMVASQRARKIGAGAPLTIDRDNDKNPVVALREIADETIEVPALKEELIRNNQRVIAIDDDGEDVIDMMDGEQEWGEMSGQDGAAPADAETAESATTEEGAETTDASSAESMMSNEAPSLSDMAGGSAEEPQV